MVRVFTCVCERERARERETVCARVYFPARRILVFSWRETREEKNIVSKNSVFHFILVQHFSKLGDSKGVSKWMEFVQ